MPVGNTCLATYALTHEKLKIILPRYGDTNTVRISSIGQEYHMYRPAFTTSKLSSSYESAGLRLQALIASPCVQKYQAVTVCRLEHEAPEDWQRLLDEIGETAGVRVEILEGGTVRIGWREYCDA